VVALRQLSFLYVIIAMRSVDAISQTIFTSFATSLLSGSLITSILYVAKLLHVLIFLNLPNLRCVILCLCILLGYRCFKQTSSYDITGHNVDLVSFARKISTINLIWHSESDVRPTIAKFEPFSAEAEYDAF